MISINPEEFEKRENFWKNLDYVPLNLSIAQLSSENLKNIVVQNVPASFSANFSMKSKKFKSLSSQLT